MTYQPVVPASGLLGWRYLSQTLDRQQEAFAASPLNQRDTDYFLENIKSVRTAEDLVDDRRMLRVALGAFGLQDDINSKAFVQKVLEGGTDDRQSLANKLSDDRYKEMAKTFGFGNLTGVETGLPGFGQKIVDKFRQSQFEVAVGQQDSDMRLALNATRELVELAEKDVSDETKWFLVLGKPPLRSVFEKALALPSSFGQIDIEKQAETMQDLASRRLGINSIDDFSDGEKVDKFVERFLLQSQISQFSVNTSSSSIALTLLQNA